MDRTQDDAHHLVERFASAAQDYLEDRFGGFWIDRGGQVPSLNVGVVQPTQDDVQRLVRDSKAVGWQINVFAVPYSMRQLTEFFERIPTPLLLGDAVLSLGASPISNSVELELNRADPELVERITALIPAEALRVCISPGVRIEPAART